MQGLASAATGVVMWSMWTSCDLRATCACSTGNVSMLSCLMLEACRDPRRGLTVHRFVAELPRLHLKLMHRAIDDTTLCP